MVAAERPSWIFDLESGMNRRSFVQRLAFLSSMFPSVLSVWHRLQ